MKEKYIIREVCSASDYQLISKFVINAGNIGSEMRTHRYDKDELLNEYQTLRLICFPMDNPLTVVGYAEFGDYPKIPALPSDCWLHWLNHHFCVPLPINIVNTIFLNTIKINAENTDLIREIIRKAFLSKFHIRFIIASQLPNRDELEINFFDELDKYANSYRSKDYDINRCENGPIVHVVKEEYIVENLRFRWALPEDNDDAMKILDIDRPDIRETYGEFYIAEQLLNGLKMNEPVHIVVGEIGDNTVGIIWLSDIPDIRTLLQNFEFENFGNLVKKTNGFRHQIEQINVITAGLSQNTQLFTEQALNDLEEVTILGGLMANESNVSVASTSKLKLFSAVDDFYDINEEEEYFFEREHLFAKYHHIYERPRHSSFYVSHNKNILNVVYNVPEGKAPEECTLTDAANVFQLKLCTVKADLPTTRFSQFLCCAFSAYPDRDYCLVYLNKEDTVSPVMHELLKYFLLVQPRPNCTMKQDLYIIHRSTLFGELWLHELRESDVQEVHAFFESGMEEKRRRSSHEYEERVTSTAQNEYQHNVVSEVMQDVLTNKSSVLQFFIIRCGNSSNPPEENAFVGLIILSQFTNIDKLYKDYITFYTPKLNHKRAQVHLFKLHSFYHVWIEDIFRALSVKTAYRKFFYLTTNSIYSLDNDIIHNMMPIEPRRNQKYWFGRYNVQDQINFLPCKLPKIHYSNECLNIYVTNLQPYKTFSNKNKVVIIGFSNYCKAFLRLMAFDWNTPEFQHKYCCSPDLDITVIELAGVVLAEYDQNFSCNICTDNANCYTFQSNSIAFIRDATKRMDLRRFVQFVYGRVEYINRESKIVVMQGGCEVKYDTLILMCHTEFGRTTLKAEKVESRPCNYMDINNRLDKIILYHKVQCLINPRISKYNILVYGANLRVIECINFLVSHRLNPKFITWVIPRKDIQSKDFNIPARDRFMEDLFALRIAALGVHILKHYKFVNYTRNVAEHVIRNVVFRNEAKPNTLKTIVCDLYISFEEAYMDMKDFLAFQKSGIEMKNKFILVNEEYQTNDKNIYAMGKYIKMRNAPNFQYDYVSEKEAAEKLIEILDLSINKPMYIFEPKYSKPHFFIAHLVLNTTFVKITMPKRYLATDQGIKADRYMITIEGGDFCRIRLGANRCINEIMVVTNKFQSLDFLEHFCGKHETLLNNLAAHWQEGVITNFLEFFTQPWTELIMHEEFSQLQDSNRRFLMPIFEKMIGKMPDNFLLRDDLLRKSQHKKSSKILQDDVMDFIRSHRDEFVNEFAMPEDFNSK